MPAGNDDNGNSNTNNKRILLVDDNADVTCALSLGLKSAGFAVDVFNNPFEALSGFRPGRYSLVISDIRMPRMSGFDLVKELGASDPLLKVILITAFDIKREEFEQVIPHIRVDAIINKPVGLVKLNNLVGVLLRNSGKDANNDGGSGSSRRLAAQRRAIRTGRD